MKKNLRFRILTGQSLLIEDVLEWSIDAQGINITQQEEKVEKVGEELKKTVQIKKLWFNSTGVITFAEEFVKA